MNEINWTQLILSNSLSYSLPRETSKETISSRNTPKWEDEEELCGVAKDENLVRFFGKRSFVPGSTSFPSRPHSECGTIKRGSSQEANEAASLQRVFRERCIVTTKKVFIETRATCPAMWNNSVTPPAKRPNVYYKICHRSHLDAPDIVRECERRIHEEFILREF